MAQIYLPYNHIIELEFSPLTDNKKWSNFLHTINLSTLADLAKKYTNVTIDNMGYRVGNNKLIILPNTRYLNELFGIIQAYEKTLTEILEEKTIKGKLTIMRTYYE